MDLEDITGLGLAVEKIAELAKDATGLTPLELTPPKEIVGLPEKIEFGFDHHNGAVKDLRDIAEQWRIYPERRKGTANVTTLQAFVDLTNRHKTANSVVFAKTSWPEPSLTSIINYHEKDGGKPAFNDHRVKYAFPITEEFKAWLNQDGKQMTQLDFAAFVENRIMEIASPTQQEELEFGDLFQTRFATPADMMMLSRGLEVHVNSAVKAQNTLASGEREVVFTEKHDTKITVPGLFMVSVPAFLDALPVRLPARLRYRVAGGSLGWFYQLYRWKELLRAAVVRDLIYATDNTDLPAYEGASENG